MNKKKRIKINVTRRDIDAAIEDIMFGQNICNTCPVARAFRRHLYFKNATVNGYSVYDKTNRIWNIELPKVIKDWISAFDYRKTRKIVPPPTHFYVEVPKCLLS